MLNIIYDIFNLPAFVNRLLNKNKNIKYSKRKIKFPVFVLRMDSVISVL